MYVTYITLASYYYGIFVVEYADSLTTAIRLFLVKTKFVRHVAAMTIGLTSITLRGEGTKVTAHLPLLTGSHDGSVKIWDIASLMSPMAATDVAELQVSTL